jgi:hypothetical protein
MPANLSGMLMLIVLSIFHAPFRDRPSFEGRPGPSNLRNLRKLKFLALSPLFPDFIIVVRIVSPLTMFALQPV